MSVRLSVETERFALARPFAISRGRRTHAEVVTVTLNDGDLTGRGECVPYARYGETVDGVIEAIEAQTQALAGGMDREALQQAMPNGAARNALDCALWDLDAKRQSEAKGASASVRAWNVAGLPAPHPVVTVYTLGLDAPEAMEAAANEAAKGLDRLKVKLGAKDGRDDDRLRAVRRGAPEASLIVDANEGWQPDELEGYLAAARETGVLMVEQPLAAGEDDALDGAREKGWLDRDDGSPLQLGADESVHTRTDLPKLKGRYDVVNVKLDKAGGLTEALSLAESARNFGFEVMVGCMMGTSLAMAPALLVAQRASYVDLDGPLWMKADRPNALRYDGQTVHPPEATLWG